LACNSRRRVAHPCVFQGCGCCICFVSSPLWEFAARLPHNPFNPQPLISHLTNSNGCGNLYTKVLLTVSPFRPFLLPQPRVSPSITPDPTHYPLSVALCFHNLTNPFSCKPFCFTSIQNPRGITLRRSFQDALRLRASVSLWIACRRQANPVVSAACGLLFSLASLFRTPILCFQQLADSFPKNRGGGPLWLTTFSADDQSASPASTDTPTRAPRPCFGRIGFSALKGRFWLRFGLI
jgi:hypothetical protein